MIPSALVVPTEEPLTPLDLKRSLLTFDQVLIPHPEDRELIPAHSYMAAMAGRLDVPFPIGIHQGPVAPLGRVPGYLDHQQATLDAMGPLVEAGKVVVQSPPPPSQGGLTIGSSPLAEGSPNPGFVYAVYRALCEQELWIDRALVGVDSSWVNQDVAAVAPESIDARARLNDGPAPALPDADLGDDDRLAVARVAYARIGSVVRSVCWATANDWVPLAAQSASANLMAHIQFDLAGTVRDVDPELASLMLRLHQVVVRDVVDPQVLDSMEPRDLLRLRDQAWGRAQEHRVRMFGELRKLAAECTDDEDFDARVLRELEAYRVTWADFQSNKRRLVRDLSIGTAVEIGATAGALAAGIGPATGIAWWFLIAGAKEVLKFADQLREMHAIESDIVGSASFALGNAYGYALAPPS